MSLAACPVPSSRSSAAVITMWPRPDTSTEHRPVTRGHFHSTRSIDELWTEDVTQPVAGGWPVLEVDTNHPLDVTSLAASIQRRP
jgi:hypothetical protein